MKATKSKRKQVTFVKGAHSPFKYKLATTPREHKKNLDLLFALQRLAYPELKPGYRMKKNVVRIIRPAKVRKKSA